jgi:hypothetical protein
MVLFMAGALTFSIASTIALLELITSRYRNTFTFLWSRWQLYAYMAIYGAFGVFLFLIIDYLVAQKSVTFEGVAVDSPWLKAVLVGISAKALMNITLFNVASGAGTVPIGMSTIVHLFEPLLLDELNLRVWNDVRTFLGPHAQKYPRLEEVKAIIERNIPPTLSGERRAALRADLSERDTVEGAMETFLYAVGRGTFVRSFPI